MDSWTCYQVSLLSTIMWADLSIKWSLKINTNSRIYSELFQKEEYFQNYRVPDS
jgi:hypothetical protein